MRSMTIAQNRMAEPASISWPGDRPAGSCYDALSHDLDAAAQYLRLDGLLRKLP